MLRIWLVLAGALLPAAAHAEYFHVYDDKLPLTVQWDTWVGNVPPSGTDIDNKLVQLGLATLPTRQTKQPTGAVGVLVEFGEGAVGVLTGEIVVKANAIAQRQLSGLTRTARLPFGKNLWLLQFESPKAALTAANQLSRSSSVDYAHPNFILPKAWRGEPHQEPLYSSQWHLENVGLNGGTVGADIEVRAAWTVTTGNPAIKVAVIDGGFETTHHDLAAAWAINSQEIEGNGVDDDSNGYIDDILGWNFARKSPVLSGGAYADHGTAVSGLVAARANDRGLTGVCPGCSIIPIAAAWTPVDDAAAFHYALSRGADVITNSWGYEINTPTTAVVEDAIHTVATTGRGGLGTTILFAMNNINRNDCIGETPDISALDAVVAISATADDDKKVSISAWGECMEFVSPSYEINRQGIATTDLLATMGYNNGRVVNELPDLDYTKRFSGTSAATPIAAGMIGLMLSLNAELSRDDVVAVIAATAEKVHPDLALYDNESGFSNKYGYGRINAANAVRAAQAFKKYSLQKKAPARTAQKSRTRKNG